MNRNRVGQKKAYFDLKYLLKLRGYASEILRLLVPICMGMLLYNEYVFMMSGTNDLLKVVMRNIFTHVCKN
jgi:hypothetical protein